MDNVKEYNAEFMVGDVKIVSEENRSVISVSKDLDINDQTLRNWINNRKGKEDTAKSKIDELNRQFKEKQQKGIEHLQIIH